MSLLDRLGRPLGTLRLSVTDRCNLRCQYCMPEEDYAWLPKDHLLTFEELATLVDAFVAQGVHAVRLTGGEPLVRRDLDALVRLLAARPGVRDLALTTNGLLLEAQAPALAAAGLGRVTVSLDTLRPERFRALARRDALPQVLAGIEAARRAGLGRGLKLDCVLLRGENDDEVCDLVEYARGVGAEVRFIEYMDVGGATRWTPANVFSRADVLRVLEGRYGAVEPLAPATPAEAAAPAERFRLQDGLVVGVVASTTRPFCRTCDRSRVTADGLWLLCLYAAAGVDLRGPLRAGAGPAELAALIASTWGARDDRGAEVRHALRERRVIPLASQGELRDDPHLEMHTRGG